MPKAFWIVLAVLGALTGFLFWAFPEFNFNEQNQMQFVSLILVSSYLLLALFQKRLNLSDTIRAIMVWGAIGVVLMTGYAFRYELIDIKDRLRANLFPTGGASVKAGEVAFPVADDGHYYVLATVNGVPIKFMVDTGASRVVLSPRDAKRLGFHPEDLSFNIQSSTANGTVWSASVTLASVTVQTQVLENIQASVSQSDLDISLLGMSYLDRLKGYRVGRGALTLQY